MLAIIYLTCLQHQIPPGQDLRALIPNNSSAAPHHVQDEYVQFDLSYLFYATQSLQLALRVIEML